MRKIVFILYSLAFGGAERRLSTIANYLVENNFEITVVLLDSPIVDFKIDSRINIVYLGTENQVISNDNASVREIACNPVKMSFRDKLKLSVLDKIDKNKFCVADKEHFLKNKYVYKIKKYLFDKPDATVISWMSYCNISTAAALSDMPNRFAFVECTSPDCEFSNDSPFNVLKRKYYPRADAAFFQTFEERDFYTYLDKTEKYVIPNPILGSFPERFEGNREKSIVNFCRLNKTKNIPLLIDAFKLFSENHKDYKLVIFGEGSEKENILSYAENCGILDKFELRNFTSNIQSEVLNYSMFVSSSDREGISNSMLESMAIGLPTVCTDCPAGGAKMVIENGINGLIVPMHDAVAMSDAMSRIADDSDFAKQLSVNSVSIKKTLSAESICKCWYDAITEITDITEINKC